MGWEFDWLYCLQKIHTPWLDQLMVKITSLADHGQFWILLGLAFLCFKKSRKIGIAVIASLILSVLIGNVILKNLVARSRPCWIDESVALLIQNPRDYSFPSGHTLASFTSSVSICLQNRRWGILAVGLAALIAFSRLYLFVHFPTDVLGGAAFGTASALFIYWVMKRKGLFLQKEGG